MDHTVLKPLGARVTGVRLDDPAAPLDEFVRLLAEHGVIAVPDQQIDDSAFVDFLSRFGELTFTTGETPVDGFPDLNIISNVGRTTAPRSTFHTDTSYVRQPPAYTALRAVSIPEQGGQTLFSDQYAAYESLPTAVRADLKGRTITHVVTGLDLDDEEETSAEHPIFRTHPVSGRTYLYMSTPARCASVSGMTAAEGAETVAYLFDHCTRDENVYRHHWSPGDVVMWDNRCVLHRADHAGVVGDRVLHRGMVLGRDGRGD